MRASPLHGLLILLYISSYSLFYNNIFVIDIIFDDIPPPHPHRTRTAPAPHPHPHRTRTRTAPALHPHTHCHTHAPTHPVHEALASPQFRSCRDFHPPRIVARQDSFARGQLIGSFCWFAPWVATLGHVAFVVPLALSTLDDSLESSANPVGRINTILTFSLSGLHLIFIVLSLFYPYWFYSKCWRKQPVCASRSRVAPRVRPLRTMYIVTFPSRVPISRVLLAVLPRLLISRSQLGGP